MKLYEEGDFKMYYDKQSKRTEEVIDLISRSQKPLRVEYAQRKEFLRAFIPLLIDKKNKNKLNGVSELAGVLHLLIDFMDADGGTNTLNANSIKTEIHNLKKEVCPKD